MGRNSSLPPLVEFIPVLSIISLRRWGYLVEGQYKYGVVSWCRKGTDDKQAAIGVHVYFYGEDRRVELDYNIGGEVIKYAVSLVSKDSNLGKGKVWYFVCPKIKKLCRKLYSVDGYFYHRKAHKELYYHLQTCSAKDRFLIRHYENACPDKASEILSRKHLKKTYKGKPTKIYKWASRKMEIAGYYSQEDISRMIMGVY